MADLESSNLGVGGGPPVGRGNVTWETGHIIVGTDRLQPYHHVALGDDFWNTSGNEFTRYHVITAKPPHYPPSLRLGGFLFEVIVRKRASLFKLQVEKCPAAPNAAVEAKASSYFRYMRKRSAIPTATDKGKKSKRQLQSSLTQLQTTLRSFRPGTWPIRPIHPTDLATRISLASK